MRIRKRADVNKLLVLTISRYSNPGRRYNRDYKQNKIKKFREKLKALSRM